MQIADLFSSRTSFLIMESLCRCHGPISLRELARDTHAPVHSVENSLGKLEKLGAVMSSREGNRRFLRLNPKFKLFEPLQQVFEVIHRWNEQRPTGAMDAKAKQGLDFCEQARTLFGKAKLHG